MGAMKSAAQQTRDEFDRRKQGDPAPEPWGRELADGRPALADFKTMPELKTGIASLDAVIVWLAATLFILVGPPGRGKSAFVIQVAMHHARNFGRVLFLSAELTYVSVVARAISQESSATWLEALRGGGEPEAIDRALIDGVTIVDHVAPDWVGRTDLWLTEAREREPDRTPLLVLDYAQVVQAAGNDDRTRVAAVMDSLRKLGQRHRAGVLVVSKGSRESYKALASGEAIGADTISSGAESSAIEYGADVQIALGQITEVDGRKFIEANLSKNRYGLQDQVIKLPVDLAHGVFSSDEAARHSSEVKRERRVARDAAKATDRRATMRLQIFASVRSFGGPVPSRRQIIKRKDKSGNPERLVTGTDTDILEEIAAMLDHQELIETSAGFELAAAVKAA